MAKYGLWGGENRIADSDSRFDERNSLASHPSLARLPQTDRHCPAPAKYQKSIALAAVIAAAGRLVQSQ